MSATPAPAEISPPGIAPANENRPTVELVPVGIDAPTDDEAGDILTAREAAAFLRVGRNCVYELAARQAIPHQRVGKHLRFSRDALVQWLSSCGRSQDALKGH